MTNPYRLRDIRRMSAPAVGTLLAALAAFGMAGVLLAKIPSVGQPLLTAVVTAVLAGLGLALLKPVDIRLREVTA